MKQRKVLVWIFAFTVDDPSELRVLLLKRPHDQGGYWQPVTGKVENGESDLQGAIREATEETGLSFPFPVVDLEYSHEFQSRWQGTPPVHEESFALRVDLNPDGSLPKPKLDPVEHVEFQWTNFNVAERQLKYDSNRTALEHLLRKVQRSS